MTVLPGEAVGSQKVKRTPDDGEVEHGGDPLPIPYQRIHLARWFARAGDTMGLDYHQDPYQLQMDVHSSFLFLFLPI